MYQCVCTCTWGPCVDAAVWLYGQTSILSPLFQSLFPILGLPAFPLSLYLLSWSLCISLAAGVRCMLTQKAPPWGWGPHGSGWCLTHTHSHWSSSAPATESPGGLTHGWQSQCGKWQPPPHLTHQVWTADPQVACSDTEKGKWMGAHHPQNSQNLAEEGSWASQARPAWGLSSLGSQGGRLCGGGGVFKRRRKRREGALETEGTRSEGGTERGAQRMGGGSESEDYSEWGGDSTQDWRLPREGLQQSWRASRRPGLLPPGRVLPIPLPARRSGPQSPPAND